MRDEQPDAHGFATKVPVIFTFARVSIVIVPETVPNNVPVPEP